ncbi:hypothetical protein ITP53_15910 [Nonomuraea sp. K274]|uniref:Uncharacterized protein n=1 Tax=Nonomuraea cypriaca TaxID=1187855 RepID=A0A931A9M6_9ACTN|nr:hypothetical protein [Nonomuraea cypriaca]MBF8187194.1 hypothetical protein [Nonomuraea cypriaca]
MLHRIATALVVGSALAAGGVAAPASAAASTAAPNLRACYDGKCNLTLTKRASFRVSPRFGITRLTITFNSQIVRVKGTAPGVMSEAVLGRSASGSVNDIGVRIRSLSGSKAVLRLSPVR